MARIDDSESGNDKNKQPVTISFNQVQSLKTLALGFMYNYPVTIQFLWMVWFPESKGFI